MKVYRYRRSVFLVRYFIVLGFVLPGILAIHDGLYHDGLFLRKALNLSVGILILSYFGRIFFMLSVIFFKSSVLFSLDNKTIVVNKREINRKEIHKVERRALMPSGILGVQVPGFIIHAKSGEKINIPTYFVLTSKDERMIKRKRGTGPSSHN